MEKEIQEEPAGLRSEPVSLLETTGTLASPVMHRWCDVVLGKPL